MFLLVLCSCRVWASCDTIPVVAQQTATRYVDISWTPVDVSVPSMLFRQYPGQGEAVQIATVTGSSYTDHHNRAVCDDTVRYTVKQSVAGQEHSGSVALNVTDIDPTSPAEWGVVTVDEPSQKIVLRWNPSLDTDIVGYMVCEGAPSIVIDTVFGHENTTYTLQDYPCDEIYHFKICAFDSCRQASALTAVCNNITLFLDADDCDREVVATWNSYQNMPGGLAYYGLWVSEDDGAYIEKMRVNDGQATAQRFSVSEQTRHLKVLVRAIGNSGEVSQSNIAEVTFGTSSRPQYMYLRKVSVCDGGTLVNVVGQTDISYHGTKYTVYRSIDGGQASVAGHCSPTAEGTLWWQDRLIQPIKQSSNQAISITYWFGVMDGCDRNEILSQKGSVVIPSVEETGGVVSVSWNAYEGWTGTTQYQLFMNTPADEIWIPVAATTATESSIDVEQGGTLRFKVVAWEGENSTWQMGDSLQGATVELLRRTEIWMPNTFTPNENSNRTFGPVFSGVSAEGYSFMVFDRHGTVVFSSTKISESWDGTGRDGKMLSTGTYVYKVTYRQSDGTEQVKTGTVLLLL